MGAAGTGLGGTANGGHAGTEVVGIGGMAEAGAAGEDNGGSEAGMSGAAGGSYCGDATTDAGESCDDGNTVSDDGCSKCSVDTGWVCEGAPSVCSHPSCQGVARICGPGNTEDCCSASLIPAGTFQRDNQPAPAPSASVSDFNLDKDEVTAGRFRKFVDAYTQDMIPQGAGRNPNNPDDTGWDAVN
jgi:sulfatase modifying factor 1